VGVVILAAIGGATAVTLGRLVDARARVSSHREAFARASAAANAIALDVQNCVRDADLTHARVAITDGGDARTGPRDELLVLMRSLRPVRGVGTRTGHNEGIEFEAGYKVIDSLSGPVLWRRVDPALDDTPDGGGVASPLAESIVGLSFEALDRANWIADWDSDEDGLPYAIRVEVTGRSDDGRTTAVARRVVAIDRVPLPPQDEEEESSEETPPASEPAGQPAGGAS